MIQMHSLQRYNYFLSSGMPRIFLAGGISRCPNWQKEIADSLSPIDVLVLNPRRDYEVEVSPEQEIDWNNKAMNDASVIVFWFPEESLCPSSLFELGKWVETSKDLIIGFDENYPLRESMLAQVYHARGDIEISDNLNDLKRRIKEFLT